MTKIAFALTLLLAAAGCGSKQPQATATEPTTQPAAVMTNGKASAPSPIGLPTDAWVGKWVGVEGLALDIEKTGTPGDYALTINLLDGSSHYIGTAQGNSIVFTRNGAKQVLHNATGAETGLKWLDGKQDCLMIRNGEGFCRD